VFLDAGDAEGELAAGEDEDELPDDVMHETAIGNPPSDAVNSRAPGFTFPFLSYTQQLVLQDDEGLLTHWLMHNMVSATQVLPVTLLV
jgi:hypothetical protein